MLTHSRKSPQVPFQEITEFLQQLVSIPSVESEQAIATCVAEKLTALGFESHLIGDPEHPSVICHHQSATATKTIWLQSHLDTAPVGDRAQWQYDPFAGTIAGDRIYGRGVADSKGAIALFIYLAKALKDSLQFNALVANGAGSVGNVISRLGIPIINAYGCESGNVHAPNEWFNLKTIVQCFRPIG